MTNIDTLTIQVETSAGAATQNIDKLAASLAKLKESGKISATVNNLSKLKGALDGLKDVSSGLQNVQKIGDALKGLQSVQKLTGLTSAINSLKKVPEITKALNTATLDAFKKKMQELSVALAPLATQLNAVGTAFGKLPAKIQQIVSGTNKMATATKKAANAQKTHRTALDATNINMAALIANVQSYIGAMQQVIQTVKTFMSQAIEWDGVQARFGRAFGDNAQESLEWVEKLSEGLMINKQEFMQYSSLFAEMLAGFGVNQKDAGKMAIGYTELAYDIWAAYNDVYKSLGGEEGAIAAVRSAIAGEVEPIRRAGFTIVDSQLAVTAAMHGVEYSTQNATEAQKSYLRYLTMVDQATKKSIVGVYAAEMTTAEGAMRTLAQQVKSLGQALGSLFIPILTAVVPYVTAFVRVIYMAAEAIAKFFNLPFFKIDWSRSVGGGVSSVGEEARGTGEEFKEATKEAKKLKNATMGFDELNIISPDSGTAGLDKSAQGALGWEGLDVDSLWDESLFNGIQAQVDALIPKMKNLLTLVGLVGAGFAAWKIYPSFLAGLSAAKTGLKFMSDLMLGLRGVAFVPQTKGFVVFSGAVTSFAKALSSNKLFAKGLIPAVVGSSGSLKAALGGISVFAAGIASLGFGLVKVWKDSENFRNGLKSIADGVVFVFEKIGDFFGWIGDKVNSLGSGIKNSMSGIIPPGVLDFFKNLDLGLGDLLVTIGGLALLGPFGLAIEGVVLAIKAIGYATGDALQPVDLFGEGISDVTKEKVEPFLEKMDDLDSTLKTLDWGNAIIDDDDAESIKNKLSGVVNTIVNELNSDRASALSKISLLEDSISSVRYEKLISDIEASYDAQVKEVTDGEAQINAIMEQAAKEHREINAVEAAQISLIQKNMKETGIKYLSESETESNLILQRLKDNATQLSAEQASGIIKSAITSRDETIKAAEEQYKGILLEAQRMLDTGTINKEEYYSMRLCFS